MTMLLAGPPTDNSTPLVPRVLTRRELEIQMCAQQALRRAAQAEISKLSTDIFWYEQRIEALQQALGQKREARHGSE